MNAASEALYGIDDVKIAEYKLMGYNVSTINQHESFSGNPAEYIFTLSGTSMLHRHDGPAIIYGGGIYGYWLWDVKVSARIHQLCKNMNEKEFHVYHNKLRAA